MGNFAWLLHGFSVLFTLQNLGATFLGCVLGLIIGAMPGIGSLAGCALLLPLTYKFNPTTAIIMLGGLYYSNMFGGAFSAILLNIPGDSPAIMTTLDGYPMATVKKRPGQALLTSNIASFIGGAIGMVILTFLGPALANLGLKFGPVEMTTLLLVAMTSIGWLVGENPVKGVLLTMFGILVASMGMDTLSGSPRYDFGNIDLLGGIPFTPFVIGVVGFSQVLMLMEQRNDIASAVTDKLTIRGSMVTRHDVKRMAMPSVRSGLLGTFVGVLPGAGATAASIMAYSAQKSFKSEEPLGSGAIEGLAASESANNAAAAGAFAPLLALGIPGSGTGAVLLGGLMMWGLNPGPLLFTNSPDFAWGLIASLFLANFLALAISWGVIPFLIKILSVPTKLLIPCITVVCMVGSYSTSNSMYGVIVMFVSGVIGYIMMKCHYSYAPLLLAFVLAPMLESNMRKAFIISRGDVGIFFQKPISLGFLIVLAAIVLFPVFRPLLIKAGIIKVKAKAAAN